MSELDLLFVLLASGFLGVSLGLISAYVILKKYINKDVFMQYIGDFLNDVSQNKDLQQQIYIVGAILGKGVASGVGLGGKSGGKMKMEDILGMAVQQFLPNILGSLGKGMANTQQPQVTQQGSEMVGIF